MALSDAERAKVQEIYEGSRWWEGSAKGKPRENNLSSNAIAETRESSEKGKKTRVNLSSNAIAGTIAGFTSSSLTHPLDVIKTRFQVQDGVRSKIPRYRGTADALLTILRTEGPFALYAGLAPNMLGSTIAWGSYFYCYNFLRGKAREYPRLIDDRGQTGPLTNMVCATSAGVVTCFATNPIWLLKTRLQLQVGEAPRYRGMLDAFAKVVKHEGPMGLYRGIVPSLLLTSHGALQFMAYEEIKKLIRKYNGGEEHLQTWQTLFASSSSKVFASCVTYPSQVVRARLQQMDPNHAASLRDTPTTDLASRQRYYRGTVDVVIKVVRLEGLLGFYKGLVPNLLRVVPSSTITFVVYEWVAKMLGAKT